MKGKIIIYIVNLLLLIWSFLLFLCIPRTVWGGWDSDAVLVIRLFGLIGLLFTILFGFYLHKENKLINLFFDIIVAMFCLYKVITTFIS